MNSVTEYEKILSICIDYEDSSKIDNFGGYRSKIKVLPDHYAVASIDYGGKPELMVYDKGQAKQTIAVFLRGHGFDGLVSFVECDNFDNDVLDLIAELKKTEVCQDYYV